MTIQEIENILIESISSIKNLPSTEIPPDQSFHELGIDSLGFVEILVFIEKQFNLELIASDLAKQDFESVRTLALFINRNL
jgi:acyl carrier protein